MLEGEQEPLPEGTRFAIVLDDDGSIRVLREAQAEIRRGNFVTEED